MSEQTRFRCAIYSRKSSEEGLDQDFNSLEAQREACEAYIRSQAHEGAGSSLPNGVGGESIFHGEMANGEYRW
jgi:DNA invertase Pin-like site-specific DNA recombinase